MMWMMFEKLSISLEGTDEDVARKGTSFGNKKRKSCENS